MINSNGADIITSLVHKFDTASKHQEPVKSKNIFVLIDESHQKSLYTRQRTGKQKIDVQLTNETVWLSLNQLTELFQRDKSVISRHIKNVFSEGELDEKSVVAFFATTAAERHFIESIDATAKQHKDYKVGEKSKKVMVEVGMNK